MFSQNDFQQRFQRLANAHHMTSIKNLDAIFRDNCIKSFKLMQGAQYNRIDNEDVQAGRAQISVPGGRPLHDYVPLYLTYKTPMSAFNVHRNQEWIYLTFDFAEVLREMNDIFITDGNARGNGTIFQKVTSISDFDIIDWPGAMRDTK